MTKLLSTLVYVPQSVSLVSQSVVTSVTTTSTRWYHHCRVAIPRHCDTVHWCPAVCCPDYRQVENLGLVTIETSLAANEPDCVLTDWY